MSNEKIFKEIRFWGQIGFWSVFWTTSVIRGFINGDSWNIAIIMTTNFVLLHAFIIYLNYFVLLPSFLEKQKYFLYVVIVIAVSTLGTFIYTKIGVHILPRKMQEFELGTWIFNVPFIWMFLATTSLFRFAQRWMENLKVQEELKKSKVETELNFLKAQIQPHFLFNTLNNIYSFAYIKHPDTPEMIANLANILRYIVYESRKEQVPLTSELKTIEMFIALYRVKNSEQKNITFQTSNIQSGHIIAPLILISLVENAFKHSDALDNNNGFIHLDIWVDESDQLIFQLKNSLKSQKMKNLCDGGVGNKNIIRQLELTYPNKYKLELVPEGNDFNQTLILQLNAQASYDLQSTYN